MTITLRDISILTGLCVDGLPVITHRKPRMEEVLHLLGREPDEWQKRQPRIGISWLVDNFSNIPDDASDEVLDQHTRAYILYFLGTLMLCDSSTNSIPAHYLLLVQNLNTCKNYAWGAAALAWIYRSLSHASQLGVTKSYGWFSLVQVPHIYKSFLYKLFFRSHLFHNPFFVGMGLVSFTTNTT